MKENQYLSQQLESLFKNLLVLVLRKDCGATLADKEVKK